MRKDEDCDEGGEKEREVGWPHPWKNARLASPRQKKNWLGLLLRQAPSFFGDRNNGFLNLDPGPHECAGVVIT